MGGGEMKMGKTPEELYEERERRVRAAIALEIPDRVPVVCLWGFFPAKVAGHTFEEAMYDYGKLMQSNIDAMIEYQPDMCDNPFPVRYLGPTLEALDFRQLRWPGHGCDPMSTYQYVEDEYMKADEYEAFLFDPSDFMLRTYWPRVFGALAPFRKLPPIRGIISYYMGLASFSALDTPDVEAAVDALLRAAGEAKRMVAGAVAYLKEMKALGFPPQFGALSQAPFDTLSDFFRGTKGAMLDLFRRPQQVLDACEKLLPIMLEAGRGARNRGHTRIFVPIHKGLDGFMSPDQFKTFFWPTLKRLLVGLIDAGMNPIVLWEGDCTSRLETIADIPAGKAVYWFERTDIFRAKEILGKTVCIRGNVPLSILCTGTPDDVKAYCRKLIDRVGREGGFIMDASTVLDDAKPENVKAMIEFTREYGVYR
jgi:uroporphyrinogen-III decarboxylase